MLRQVRDPLFFKRVERCSASEAAAAALVVATRAAVDRCGPGHVAPSPTGTEEGQGRGGGFRVERCGEDPEASPSPGGRHRVLSDGRG